MISQERFTPRILFLFSFTYQRQKCIPHEVAEETWQDLHPQSHPQPCFWQFDQLSAEPFTVDCQLPFENIKKQHAIDDNCGDPLRS